MVFESWGRTKLVEQVENEPGWRSTVPSLIDRVDTEAGYLPVGQGRSYGDSCLNAGGTIIHNRALDRILDFDTETETVTCEAGMTLGDLLLFCVPRGYFLPVTPGTKFVSLAGAIANDVHGKNHHIAGSFGNYVKSLELVRSDSGPQLCSPTQNPALFHATIGGLGLTGFIVTVTVQLKRMGNSFISAETIPFASLDEFLDLSKKSQGFEYSVAWLDCLSRGSAQGRGIFFQGSDATTGGRRVHRPRQRASIPFVLPQAASSTPIMKLFNTVYYHTQKVKRGSPGTPVHYDPFFYPLDAVGHWNRVYGKSGFYQFQAVVPRVALPDLLKLVVNESGGSFLAVLKEFGERKSVGMLSFPRPGYTLALDFANRGVSTLRTLAKLEEFVHEVAGKDAAAAIYPAKDATMGARSFRTFFPKVDEFVSFIDPAASSSFWRRVYDGAR